MEKRVNTREARRRQIRRRAALLLLLAAAVTAGAVWAVLYGPSFKKKDKGEYFREMMGTDEQLSDTSAAIMLEDHFADCCAKVVDGFIYLPYEMVRSNITSRFFWDEENSVMLYTTADETLHFEPESAVYTEDGAQVSVSSPVVRSIDGTLYLSADYLCSRVNVRVEDYTQDYHITVHYRWGDKYLTAVRKDSTLRCGASVKAPILTKISAQEQVIIMEEAQEGEKWAQVLTAEGYIGYLPAKNLGETVLTAVTNAFEGEDFPSMHMDETVNLVWHMIGVEESNDYFKQDTTDMTGVNVISPTWFSLSDNEGNFTSLASKSYVKKAHKKGLQVWGLVSNFSADMRTTELVKSTAARLALAQNLVDAAKEYGFDGINVDFEAIEEEAGYGYVQFIRELSVLCRAEGLYLSVDIPEPYDFNAHYDYAELGVYCDYVIVMGYDEHYVGSEAGSVASLAFEENGLQRLLDVIPSEKLISGVPFYTRMWYDQDGAVWSEILGMTAVSNTLESYQVEPVWNEETQQYYAEWTLDDGIVCRIWVEDETSIALKAALVPKYKLGGIAAWALGNERASIWEVITENIAGESKK